ncbi:MAG TPA: hypothetical protein VGI43_18520, partial [Mucilaginibacter sp.]
LFLSYSAINLPTGAFILRFRQCWLPSHIKVPSLHIISRLSYPYSSGSTTMFCLRYTFFSFMTAGVFN